MTETTKVYAVARKATAAMFVIREPHVVATRLGVFALRKDAEQARDQLVTEALQTYAQQQGCRDLAELTAKVGESRVQVVSSGYIVMELDLHGQPPAVAGNARCRLCDPGEQVNLDDLPDDFVIPAEVHTDDYHVRVVFDAVPWFRESIDEELVGLAEIGWGGDVEADAIVRILEGEAGYEPLRRLLAYCRNTPQTGFEVHVSRQAALAWLKANNAALYQQLATAGD